MNNFIFQFIAFFIMSIVLTACSTNIFMPTGQPFVRKEGAATYISSSGRTGMLAQVKESRVPISGHLSKSMDEMDRSKMWHALDNPVGKSTSWVSGGTGISYTITPTKKVTVHGNQICRRYSTTAVKGNQTKQMVGTACVSSDGNWHPVD